ncbi:hypothetical protein [Rhodoferax fermentans]|nr:hypothetical protein [Rhodoferax fermentans]
MGLRTQLKATVASCAPKQTQPATLTENSATGIATQAQQHPANPQEVRVLGATAIATRAQQAPKTGATQGDSDDELRVAFATPRNSQLSFAAMRLANEAIAAAMRRCDQFNDSATAREQMRLDVLAVPAHQQQDLLDHFNGKPAHF